MIPGATLVTVLRHGAVRGRAHVYRGALDEPMSDAGMARLARVAQRLAVPPYTRIASSPLRRCQDFAQAYAEAQGLPLDRLADFRELGFGAWEGLTPEEAARRDPDHHHRFRDSAGTLAPPGGESLPQLRARVGAAWHAWLAESRDGHRLLVTHAGVMRALLMELFGLAPERVYQIALPEAAQFQVSHLPGEPPVLLALNPCAD